MALVESVGDWAQVALNAGALIAGGTVWKMYFDNLKATIAAKESAATLAKERTDYWREKATELEKRSPEVIEDVLAKRIAIRESEIQRLSEDRDHGSRELERLKQEMGLIQRTLEQTKGFRQVLAMETPNPGDPDYQEYLEYSEKHGNDSVVDVEVVYLGEVGVDSAQLVLTDPRYIDSQWDDEPFQDVRIYKDTQTGQTFRWGEDFVSYDDLLDPYGKSPNDLIDAGRLAEVPDPPAPETFKYSYNGACQATLSKGYGELAYRGGQRGAGVVFSTGWGDGFYSVYGEKHDGRIMRVYVNLGAEPPRPSPSPSSS